MTMQPSPEQVAEFIKLGSDWVKQQRGLHRAQGQPLMPAAEDALRSFLSTVILDTVRLRALPVLPNHPLQAQSAALGLNMDFSTMEGITFDDTIVITNNAAMASAAPGLLFHELVHVAQYKLLGVDEFVKQYVEGLLASGEYHAIPLEMAAYTAQARYSLNPAQGFSVEDYVQRTVNLRRS